MFVDDLLFRNVHTPKEKYIKNKCLSQCPFLIILCSEGCLISLNTEVSVRNRMQFTDLSKHSSKEKTVA